MRLDRHAGKMRGLDPVYHSHLSLPHGENVFSLVWCYRGDPELAGVVSHE